MCCCMAMSSLKEEAMSSNAVSSASPRDEQAKYLWREIRTRQELLAVLSLRFRTYRATPGMSRLASLDEPSHLDADAYDG